jgi:hypothetical protein
MNLSVPASSSSAVQQNPSQANAPATSRAPQPQPQITESKSFPSRSGSDAPTQARHLLGSPVDSADTAQYPSNTPGAPAGHTVGSALGTGEKPDVSHEAILPSTSSGGGTYTYTLDNANPDNPTLYRRDSATGSWEQNALPREANGGKISYKLEGSEGQQYVTQQEFGTRFGDRKAFVPGPFSPSNSPSGESGSKPAASAADQALPQVVPPEYQLPTTGPNGEQYTYGLDRRQMNGHTEQWLLRTDTNTGTTAHAPLHADGVYSIRTDGQNHPYVSNDPLDPGFNPNGDYGPIGPQPVSGLHFLPDATPPVWSRPVSG